MLHKKILSVVMTFLFLTNLALAGVNNQPAEEEAVKKAIELYAKSTDKKDGSTLADMFHEDAKIYAVNKFNNRVKEFSSSEFVNEVKKGKYGGWDRELSIQSVDVYGNTAVAKVELKDKKLKQTEFLSLVKDKKGWKIVSCSLTREKA